jgi:hypothetical protein
MGGVQVQDVSLVVRPVGGFDLDRLPSVAARTAVAQLMAPALAFASFAFAFLTNSFV